MTISIALAILALMALIFLIRMASGHGGQHKMALEDPTSQIQVVDVNAFRNLVDPAEEQYLRDNLTKGDFTRIQRERLRAAIEYAACASRNAAFLLRVGDAARSSSDPALADAGEKLVANALHLRLYAAHAIARLYLGILFPGTRISLVSIAERYDNVVRMAVVLQCFSPDGRPVSPVG